MSENNLNLEKKRNQIYKINSEINVLKNNYTNELNTVNHYYWPIIARIRKQMTNLKWYFTLACCFMFSVIVYIIFKEVYNLYWVIPLLTFSGGIVGLVVFFWVRCNKKNKLVNKDWKDALKPSDELNAKINDKSLEAKNMMIEFFNDLNSLNNIYINIDEIGTSYEDILDYYNRWTDNN